MTLDTSIERHSLALDRPFRIARGTTDTAEQVVVTITDGHHEGIGAASPSRRYGETAETVEAVLPALLDVVEDAGDAEPLQGIERRLDGTVCDNPAARAAVSIALHDLVARRREIPLYRYWGLDPTETVQTSYTISIDDPETMARRAERAVDRGHSVLKLKLGTDADRERVAAVRQAAPEARIRVDANEAWRPTAAVETIAALAEYDVEFVEQPVPAESPGALQYVHERSPLPIAADESCVTLADLPAIADCCSIVTLKLMKCGGLREAVRLVHAARAHGLDVMLGCMIESNASIAAACQLTPLVDYADLDGSLLLDEDPYAGVPVVDGAIDLSAFDETGTGARRTP
jgi:L-alanine-DL-glutamate epimerase-like enolase superfamily enzyme